jgi:hypothetical protein
VTYIKKLSTNDSSFGESTFVLSYSTGEREKILSVKMLRKKLGWRIVLEGPFALCVREFLIFRC